MHISRVMESRDSNTTALPSNLQDAIPYCAQGCVSKYLNQQYTCPTTDFSCFCSHYSSSGFTLGELAYGCLITSCSGSSEALQTSLYQICNGQDIIAIPTHTAITLPPLTTSMSSSRTTTTTVHTTSTLSSTIVLTSTTPLPTNDTSTTPHSSDLSTAQATGISIAAFAALVIAGLIVFLILFLRKRRDSKAIAEATSTRERKRESYDFIDEGLPRGHPFITRGLAVSRLKVPEAQQPAWHGQTNEQAHGNHTVRHVDHQAYRDRQSNESVRTVSQLLPDKPVPLPENAAEAISTRREPAIPRFVSVKRPPTAMLINAATYIPTPQRQPALQIDIPRTPERSPEARRSRLLPAVDVGKAASPSRHNDISPQSGRDKISPTTDISRNVSPQYRMTDASPNEKKKQLPKLDLTTSVTPQYRIRNANIIPASITPIEDSAQRRKPVPTGIRVPKPACPEKAYRQSRDSDTSFESTDPDEPTPEKQQISPDATTPVAYPRIPRSSNQAVSRSPGTGLIASATQTPPRRFYPKDTPRTEIKTPVKASPGQKVLVEGSPLKGYGRNRHDWT